MDKEVMECPKCKKKENVVRIIYGMPPADMAEKENNDFILGGCVINLNEQWHCKACKINFGEPMFPWLK